ncbi:NusA-like transcription termination signal-binding factor [Candidatus Woesearchaeota archaeon]|nr:NusA-like transcription termination signal-binding factor [Candidatus Woesearchaeota archaeon]MBW3021340.1 NusA-like transcription termination signal-binding factor [Candidatus Woesearchaeota archaeon]
MKYISLFETITRAKVKDCFELGEKLVFVVQEGEIGKAIGKKAANVKKIEGMLKKRIRIIEFNPDLIRFINNVIYPVKAKNIEQDNSIITITSPDSHSRGLLIGKAAEILRNNEKIVQRYFEIEEIKVI